MQYTFVVNNDKITCTQYDVPYTGNINTYRCVFQITSDIEGLVWFCVFSCDGKAYVKHIEDGECYIPKEVLLSEGVIKIGCYATNLNEDDYKLLSTNWVYFNSLDGAYSEASIPEIPEPDVWAELVLKSVPVIRDNGNWHVFSIAENKYIDTGVNAQGHTHDGSQNNTQIQIKCFKPSAEFIDDTNKLYTITLDSVDSLEVGKCLVKAMCAEDGTFMGFESRKITAIEPLSNVVTLASKFSYLPDYTKPYEPTIKNGVIFSESLINVDTGKAIGSTDLVLENDDIKYIHLEGIDNKAVLSSSVQGSYNIVSSFYSHSEGSWNIASGIESHTEGSKCVASGKRAHAEGTGAIATAAASHAEGASTEAHGEYSHAEGLFTITEGERSHAEGYKTKAIGIGSHAEGEQTISEGFASHAEGASLRDYELKASGYASHAEGGGTEARGNYSHSEGYQTFAIGIGSHAEGKQVAVYGEYSHGEGITTTVRGNYSHVEGQNNYVTGDGSHAEGENNSVSADKAHAEGYKNEIQSGATVAHVEGYQNIVSGEAGHAEGRGNTVSGARAHAEGDGCTASANFSHAEGKQTSASARMAHAEGELTEAKGQTAHAEGRGTIAAASSSHAEGRWNIEDTAGTYAHILGNGSSADSRSNAHTVDWNGNAWFAGDITIGANKDKVDVETKIETLSDTTHIFEFLNTHNAEKRLSEVTSISFIMEDGEYVENYISGLSFDSGETATSIDYTGSGILNWVGTDCTNVDGLSIFQPSTNTHYDIVFYFNGAQFIGLVNGFVPATGNEAV
jgi:hypothetical protein